MNCRPLLRSLLASAAVAAAIALAGCDTETAAPTVGGRHLQPLSERLLADIEKKNMEKDSAILVRIFKEEAELEVWKENKDGRFALLRTYPICRWSGELGPKIKEGDRQAPEGFYPITPGLMNPNSQYHLAINTGFPNSYDRANGRTGDFLMIHGDCSSRGCYAMTDEQISEIYALAREAFFGGQKSFQVQAFPFRMTAMNMARHRNSPHMAFWKMLKQGYDHFEVTRLEPKVDVCDRHYVFNAEASARFSPAESCPAYRVPEDIANAVRDKQHRDEQQTAELISRGTPALPVKMGVDGGMNPTFLAAVKTHGLGSTIHTSVGTIPAHVNPPGEPAADTGTTGGISLASTESKPVAAPASSVQVASASNSGGIGGFFSNLFTSKSDERAAESRPDKPTSAKPEKGSRATKPTRTASVRSKSEAQATPKPQGTAKQQSANAATPAAAAQPESKSDAAGLLNGAAPTVSSGGFENRFGSWR
ncbi:MAG: L,D-transpeptidase family protein [Xanthobacteraceae bacterium]